MYLVGGRPDPKKLGPECGLERGDIIMTNGIDIEPVPRHKEINEQLARAIIKRRNL